MSAIFVFLAVTAMIIVGIATGSRDKARVIESLRDIPGEVVEVSFRGARSKGRGRVYRVVCKLPSGARLLHRVVVYPDGSVERLL